MQTLISTHAADVLRKSRDYQGAIGAYQQCLHGHELPDPNICLNIARCFEKLNQHAQACAWLARVCDGSTSFVAWHAASTLLNDILTRFSPAASRSAKVFLTGSYTTVQFAPMLQLAAWRAGIVLQMHQGDYGQYRQDILDPGSRLYQFQPDAVVLALHADEVPFPMISAQPDDEISAELVRWRSMWQTLGSRSRARLVMHNFAIPPENAFGHLAARLPGVRSSLLQRLNLELGTAAESHIGIVDCDRISSTFGKGRWFDARYWHRSKQAVALDALPLLAQHTAAVLAGQLGLAKKCLILDLDNTLWGGVIGEDGLAGIQLGSGSPEGEAYGAFQQFILELKHKGVILAVCSKNNDADAREPFLRHPDMKIKLDDLAMFVANWEPKPDNIRHIAKILNIGLDSFVFVDDNPAEREIVRQNLPQVEVIALPTDPSGYTRALADCLHFETPSFTSEDAARTRQYRAKAEIVSLESSCTSIEDFHRSLQMKAVVQPFDELHLPRIVQLIGKTNQFNLTTRRHSLPAIRQFMADSQCVHFYLKLRDRFAEHGLVGVMIAMKRADVLEIDTWLMSCRVIGRGVEALMLSCLCARASDIKCTRLRGFYVPTAKNSMVQNTFQRYGFTADGVGDAQQQSSWTYDILNSGPIVPGLIDVEESNESSDTVHAA
jgi:FkbH-like protein